jgi:ribosomal protein S18 acetylase RimI-like enzyme
VTEAGTLPLPDLLLRHEREFVQVFGGYAVEIPGGTLVVNEKVAVPRFNYVQDVRVAPHRLLAFVERALEHYYQRALRPTFELPRDLDQPHLDRALGKAGYAPSGDDHQVHLLAWDPGTSLISRDEGIRVERVPEEERPTFAGFWTVDRYQEEVVRSLDVTEAHPNPTERLVPYLAMRGGEALGVATYYAYRGVRGIHAVAVRPEGRGQGVATALVREVLRCEAGSDPGPLGLRVEGREVPGALRDLGFRPVATFDTYVLDLVVARQGV